MEIKNKNTIRLILILLVGVFIGWLIFGDSSSDETQEIDDHTAQHEHTIWTWGRICCECKILYGYARDEWKG